MKSVSRQELPAHAEDSELLPQPGEGRLSREEKKHRVYLTARRLFVELGYHKVSIQTIVKASGVSTGAIYSYFPNKEALASYIHEQTLADFQTLFLERLEGRETTRDKLSAFAEVVFELTEQDPEVMEYLLFMRHGEFMQDCSPICFTEPFRLVQGIIKQGIEQGDIQADNVFVAGIAYTGVILRAAELRLKCVLERPLTDIAEELLIHAWKAISP
ncbi:MAG: TetR/AcrR family transcriptional regulator [Desulfuromonadales bacterium]|nr:TetR/AcrR family transcriptional regulator [Desulfuromonadales bacterium]